MRTEEVGEERGWVEERSQGCSSGEDNTDKEGKNNRPGEGRSEPFYQFHLREARSITRYETGRGVAVIKSSGPGVPASMLALLRRMPHHPDHPMSLPDILG